MSKNNGLKLRISSEAYDVIINESKKWAEHGLETGTCLIGYQDLDGFTITHALMPGPNAKRAPASFSPDVEYINIELKKLRDKYGVDFLGIHHLHPGNMYYPSGDDLRQAIEILRDPDYKINGRLLSIISIKNKEEIIIFPYVITKEKMRFERLNYEIITKIPKKSVKTKQRKAGSLLSIWLSGRVNKEKRVSREIQDIVKLTGDTPIIKATKEGIMAIEVNDVLFLLPTEYPFSPPRVFLKGKNKLRELILDEQYRWNSAFDIRDLLYSRRLKLHFVRKSVIGAIFLLIKRAWQVLNMPIFKRKKSQEVNGDQETNNQ